MGGVHEAYRSAPDQNVQCNEGNARGGFAPDVGEAMTEDPWMILYHDQPEAMLLGLSNKL